MESTSETLAPVGWKKSSLLPKELLPILPLDILAFAGVLHQQTR
jgi:hypothetical protein